MALQIDGHRDPENTKPGHRGRVNRGFCWLRE